MKKVSNKVKSKRAQAMALRRAESLDQQKAQAEYNFDRGLQEGKRQTENDIRLKLAEANIKLSQQLGAMVEATARAVIAFSTELPQTRFMEASTTNTGRRF